MGDTDELTTLAAAIDGLYVAFAAHPLRDWTDPCLRCCATSEEEEALHRYPLRELPVEVLFHYAVDSMTTWGDERELLHFLPRILEVVAEGGFPQNHPDAELLFQKIRRAGWTSWPDAERDAVDTYLRALWTALIAGLVPISGYRFGDAVCAFGNIVDDLDPYLLEWSRSTSLVGSELRADFAEDWALGSEGDTLNPWWDDRDAQRRQVEAWFRSR